MKYGLLALLGLGSLGCQKKDKNMRTNYLWSPSVCAPRHYPIEVLQAKVGYGDKGKTHPISGRFHQYGLGTIGGGGYNLNSFDIEWGGPIPNSLEILWASYTEKKYYKANVKFSDELQNSMLELFAEGYYAVREKQRFRYDNLVITLLPKLTCVLLMWKCCTRLNQVS